MTEAVTIAVLDGDDIGPEVIGATVTVLDAAARARGVAVDWQRFPSGVSAVDTDGSTLPDSVVDRLREIPAVVMGPFGTHAYPTGDPRFRNPSGYLRKNFLLYSNIRPARSWPGVRSVSSKVDLVIVRENTEGFYADRNVLDGNGELRPDADTVMSMRVITRRASTRVARQAFELARDRGGMRKVTAVHKANVLRRGDGLFLEACNEVAKDYQDVVLDDSLVDAFAMKMVMRPENFDVVVTTNMFGDILSDMAAGLVGGLGVAPGLNVGKGHAAAQAVHGSAPDIAGRGIANPIAEILSGALLFGWMARTQQIPALHDAQRDIDSAVGRVLADDRVKTPDLGGSATTAEITDAIVGALEARTPASA